MAVVIDGTNGVTTPAESVTGTGVWSVGGSQIYKDASGNVGIGTSSPQAKAVVSNGGAAGLEIFTNYPGGGVGTYLQSYNRSSPGYVSTAYDAADHSFRITGTERARIDSSGNLLVGKTTLGLGASGCRFSSIGGEIVSNIAGPALYLNKLGANGDQVYFYNASSFVGFIGSTSTTTSYNTTSDYRLKNTIAPMTGALDKVALLKPCTYKWIVDGSDGQGFIAHELDEVVPGCVTGEKDAVDAEGKPQYQGIDTSFLVATLTAAIQELKAIIDTQATRITALEAK